MHFCIMLHFVLVLQNVRSKEQKTDHVTKNILFVYVLGF